MLSGIKVFGLPPGATKAMLAKEMLNMQKQMDRKEAKKHAEATNTDKFPIEPPVVEAAKPSPPAALSKEKLAKQKKIKLEDVEEDDISEPEGSKKVVKKKKKKVKSKKDKAIKVVPKPAGPSSYHERAMAAGTLVFCRLY